MRKSALASVIVCVGVGCSSGDDESIQSMRTESIEQPLLSPVSVLGWYPGSGTSARTRIQTGLFYAEDVGNNPASALQDAFTGRNDALKPAFRQAFTKYSYDAQASDSHPQCPAVTAPTLVINNYAKPYEFAQAEFLSWLSANTGQTDFLSPAARRVNAYRGNQECPLTSTDTTLARTFGQRIRVSTSSISLTTDNAVNPWRWVAPINPVHHHEQPSLFVTLPTRDQATKDEIRALLAANLRGDLSKRLILEYDIDFASVDLRTSMGESTAASVVGTAPGQDLLSATFHNTRRFTDARFNEYLDTRFVAPSLQASIAVNWRENDAGYRLSEFQLVGFNYKPALIWGPPSPNATINAYTTEGGGSGISAWTRVKAPAMKLPGLTPSIFVSGGDYTELGSASYTGKLAGTIDLSAYYLVSHGHQFFPGLPDTSTHRNELSWIGFVYEAHGPMKVTATVRRLNARVVSALSGACGTTLNTCQSGTFADVTDTTTEARWSCVGSFGGTTASCAVTKINGVCGAQVDTCAAGSFADVADTTTETRWSCVGSSGGTTASCGVSKTNGVCGTQVNTCAAGSFADVADSSTDALWQCRGSNGGTTAQCATPLVTWFWVNRTANSSDHGVSYPGYPPPAGYVIEGPVFRATGTAGSGLHALYDCRIGTNTFVSSSSTCEGQTRVSAGPIGHVFSQAGSGRTPIYRCSYGGDHFVSTSSSCEIGISPEGILGYF